MSDGSSNTHHTHSFPLRPKIRSLEPFPLDEDGDVRIVLKDSANLGQGSIVLTPYAFQLTTLMDGTRTAAQICQAFETLTGQQLETELLEEFIEQLDGSFALDNEKSRGHLRTMGDRPCSHAGSAYPSQPQELKHFLDHILEAVPPLQTASPLVGLIVPHIDLGRGARTYGQAFQELRAQLDDFDTFVILGISHAYTSQPFVLTRLNFATPLGTVETDQEFVEELALGLEFDPFTDEFNHLGEHSVELQAVFLRHMLPRPFRIVPILCGSFHRCLMGERALSPKRLPGVESFVNRLHQLLKTRPRTLILASVDLAHQGERFDMPPLDESFLAKLQVADALTLERATDGDSEGFMASLHGDRGHRNYCGTPAIYTMLEVLDHPKGTLHGYQQCNEPGLTSTVSVAAAGFYR